MNQTMKNSKISGECSTSLSPKLNRFTSLPVALDMLSRKHMTLLSPDTWDDRNDAYFVEQYRGKLGFQSVLAICFSMGNQTYHHWRVFSHGSSGVCIEFDKDSLLKTISKDPNFRSGKVEYFNSQDFESCPEIDKWPFLKRKPFRAEAEFRIIYETDRNVLRSKDVNIDIRSIRKITLSPWIPEAVAESVIGIIRGIKDCTNLKVVKSTLLDNARWRSVINEKGLQNSSNRQ